MVLGLIGRTQTDELVTDECDVRIVWGVGAMALATFIVSAYAELFSASWLWVPPRRWEVHVGGRLLCRMHEIAPAPVRTDLVGRHIVTLLLRLKLVRIEQEQLHLTRKGLNFVKDAVKE
jgi:hypothetical protein